MRRPTLPHGLRRPRVGRAAAPSRRRALEDVDNAPLAHRALAVENAARFPPRAPLPTASKALTILIYLTNHNNIQGSAQGAEPEGISVGDQAMWSRSDARTGDRGGALRAGRDARGSWRSRWGLRWRRGLSRGRRTGAMSMSNTRLSTRGQLRRASANGWGVSP